LALRRSGAPWLTRSVSYVVWKRDGAARLFGVECPHCRHRIEFRGGFVKQLEDGLTFVAFCPEALCGRRLDIDLARLGGSLWDLDVGRTRSATDDPPAAAPPPSA